MADTTQPDAVTTEDTADAAPALSSPSAAEKHPDPADAEQKPSTPSPDDDSCQETVGSPLHKLLNEGWGIGSISAPVYNHLKDDLDLQKLRKTKKGLEFGLQDGSLIVWTPPSQHAPEMICGPKKNFDEKAADAMVALARARGWKTLALHGKPEHKEKLWLAVQRQNLEDEKIFKQRQAAGEIPKTDKEGDPVQYTPLSVENFEPMRDSAIYQQWVKECNERQAAPAITSTFMATDKDGSKADAKPATASSFVTSEATTTLAAAPPAKTVRAATVPALG